MPRHFHRGRKWAGIDNSKTSECRPLGIFQLKTVVHRLHVSLQMWPLSLSLLMRERNNFIGILVECSDDHGDVAGPLHQYLLNLWVYVF